MPMGWHCYYGKYKSKEGSVHGAQSRSLLNYFCSKVGPKSMYHNMCRHWHQTNTKPTGIRVAIRWNLGWQCGSNFSPGWCSTLKLLCMYVISWDASNARINDGPSRLLEERIVADINFRITAVLLGTLEQPPEKNFMRICMQMIPGPMDLQFPPRMKNLQLLVDIERRQLFTFFRFDNKWRILKAPYQKFGKSSSFLRRLYTRNSGECLQIADLALLTGSDLIILAWLMFECLLTLNSSLGVWIP